MPEDLSRARIGQLKEAGITSKLYDYFEALEKAENYYDRIEEMVVNIGFKKSWGPTARKLARLMFLHNKHVMKVRELRRGTKLALLQSCGFEAA